MLEKRWFALQKKEKILEEVAQSFIGDFKEKTRQVTIKKHLDNNGAKDQLVMFLSGKAGSGKSHVIESVRIFLKVFCDNCDIPFNDDIIKITACTGSAASLFVSGKTIHGAAFRRKKRIVKNIVIRLM